MNIQTLDQLKEFEYKCLNLKKIIINKNNFKRNVDNHNTGHIIAAVQNIILRYGNTTEFGITEGEEIAGSIVKNPQGTQSNIWCPLIWKALSQCNYNIPNYTYLNDKAPNNANNFDTNVTLLKNISWWCEYAVEVLNTDFGPIPDNSNDFQSDFVISNSDRIMAPYLRKRDQGGQPKPPRASGLPISQASLKKINLNPKIQLGNNGNNYCWLNTSMYIVIAYWDFFKQFHNDNILKRTYECDFTNFEKYKDPYEKIYNYLNILNETDEWGDTQYMDMRQLLQDLSDHEFKDSKGNPMTINLDVPEHGKRGNAQEFYNIFINSIFKECPIASVITTTPKQIGKNHGFKVEYLSYCESGCITPYKYKLIAILKPTQSKPYADEEELASGVVNPNDETEVCHWTAYVRIYDNWLNFDMLKNGGTDPEEINFDNLKKEFENTEGEDVYHCLFVYLNNNHIE